MDIHIKVGYGNISLPISIMPKTQSEKIKHCIQKHSLLWDAVARWHGGRTSDSPLRRQGFEST